MAADFEAELLRRIDAAFPAATSPVPMTLARGDDVDGGRVRPAVDGPSDWRQVDDATLEGQFHGLVHLDPVSWRFYLPAFLGFAARRGAENNLVTAACIQAVRLPDRDPPRLATLTPAQRLVVRALLQHLADGSAFDGEAQQVLTEYWLAELNNL